VNWDEYYPAIKEDVFIWQTVTGQMNQSESVPVVMSTGTDSDWFILTGDRLPYENVTASQLNNSTYIKNRFETGLRCLFLVFSLILFFA